MSGHVSTAGKSVYPTTWGPQYRGGDGLRQPQPELGTGVAFTRDPATGNRGVYGDYLQDAQGEDVVAGIRNTMPLQELEDLNEDVYKSCSA